MQELINFLSNRVVNLLLVVIKTDLACPDCLCENRNVFKDRWSFFAEPDQKTFDRCFPIAICDQNLQSDVVLFSFNNSTGHFWSKNWDLSRNLFFSVFQHTFSTDDICILPARKKTSAIIYSYREITQTCFSSDPDQNFCGALKCSLRFSSRTFRGNCFEKLQNFTLLRHKEQKKLYCDFNSIIH